MGYHRAGFEVVGVDHKPQPNYPFEFHQDDALAYLIKHGHEFDAVHASPPCQGYSKHAYSSSSANVPHHKGTDEPKLIGPIREAMPMGRPFIIENVVGARDSVHNPILLCGSMFGLHIPRHRLFECSHLILQPSHPQCRGISRRYAAAKGINWRDVSVTGKSRGTGCIDTWREVMGMPWAGRAWELSEAIPPAFTEYLGHQLINHLNQ